MRPPFVVVSDDRSILLFETVVTDLEPPDVDCCFAFDSNGKVLSFEIKPVEYQRRFLGFKSHSKYEGVVLVEAIPAREDPASLKKALTNYLNVYHKMLEDELQGLSVSELIEEVKSKKKPARDGSYL